MRLPPNESSLLSFTLTFCQSTVSLYCFIVIWCFQGLSEHPSTSQHYPRLNPVSTHLSPDSPYLLLRNIPAVRLSKLSPQATHSHTAMGASLSRLWSLIWTKKEIRILILGLYVVSTCSIRRICAFTALSTNIWCFQIGEVVTTIPTIGFNVESVTYRNLNLNVWDLGGQTSIRPYWRCYYANTAAVVFVIDSTDIERLGTAADELAAMLNEEELREAALLVFANKQDQPGAKGAGEISEALKLGELRDRNWSIVACSAIDGKGINEGMDWLVQTIQAENA
ncbi:hypothetical protein VI817_000811 [Penicillium citrinum]|nr:hypothetical protein VI817_000811 [Penicillium citrinum]